jgi:hypothetical protein
MSSTGVKSWVCVCVCVCVCVVCLMWLPEALGGEGPQEQASIAECVECSAVAVRPSGLQTQPCMACDNGSRMEHKSPLGSGSWPQNLWTSAVCQGWQSDCAEGKFKENHRVPELHTWLCTVGRLTLMPSDQMKGSNYLACLNPVHLVWASLHLRQLPRMQLSSSTRASHLASLPQSPSLLLWHPQNWKSSTPVPAGNSLHLPSCPEHLSVTADNCAPRSLSPAFLPQVRKAMMTSIWWW